MTLTCLAVTAQWQRGRKVDNKPQNNCCIPCCCHQDLPVQDVARSTLFTYMETCQHYKQSKHVSKQQSQQIYSNRCQCPDPIALQMHHGCHVITSVISNIPQARQQPSTPQIYCSHCRSCFVISRVSHRFRHTWSGVAVIIVSCDLRMPCQMSSAEAAIVKGFRVAAFRAKHNFAFQLGHTDGQLMASNALCCCLLGLVTLQPVQLLQCNTGLRVHSKTKLRSAVTLAAHR